MSNHANSESADSGLRGLTRSMFDMYNAKYKTKRNNGDPTLIPEAVAFYRSKGIITTSETESYGHEEKPNTPHNSQ